MTKITFDSVQLVDDDEENDTTQRNGYLMLKKAAQYRTKIVLSKSANILNQRF